MPELNDQKLPWSLGPRASVTETPKTLVEEALEQVEQENKRLRAALNDIFEMWAGSEGFIPKTAPEGYLLMLVKKMADRAALAKMEESK